jgi:hypothetical protein
MDASSALRITGLRPDKSTRGSGRSSANPHGFESGDSNLSKLTDVFATMQLTGPDVSLRLVILIPLAIKSCIFKARIEHYSNLFLLLNESFVYLQCLCIFIGRAKRGMNKQRLGVQSKTRRRRPSRIRTHLGFIQTDSICNWLGEQSRDPTFAYERLGGRS